MKWYSMLSIACGIAFLVPQLASAQPVPPPPGHGHGVAAPDNPGHHGKNHGKDHGKKHPKKDEDNSHHAKPAPAPAHHPGPAPAPAPGHVHHPAPAPGHVHHPVVPPAPPAPPAHVVVEKVYVPVPVAPPQPVFDPSVEGMHPSDFANLLDSIDRATFKGDKLNVIRSASSNYFTCSQVKQIMLRLTFDSDRVEAACMLYSSVVDRNNWFTVLDAATFSSSRDAISSCAH